MLNSILLCIIGGQEIFIILLIVLVFWGGKKIPELMRGLGKGVKEYKKALHEVDDVDTENNKPKESSQGKDNIEKNNETQNI